MCVGAPGGVCLISFPRNTIITRNVRHRVVLVAPRVAPRASRPHDPYLLFCASECRWHSFLRIFLRYKIIKTQKCQKPQKPVWRRYDDGMPLVRSILLTFLVKQRSQAFKLSRRIAATAHGILDTYTRRIVLTKEKYLSSSFPRLCPRTDSLFVGRSVINTPPSSKLLKRQTNLNDHQYKQYSQ